VLKPTHAVIPFQYRCLAVCRPNDFSRFGFAFGLDTLARAYEVIGDEATKTKHHEPHKEERDGIERKKTETGSSKF